MVGCIDPGTAADSVCHMLGRLVFRAPGEDDDGAARITPNAVHSVFVDCGLAYCLLVASDAPWEPIEEHTRCGRPTGSPTGGASAVVVLCCRAVVVTDGNHMRNGSPAMLSV